MKKSLFVGAMLTLCALQSHGQLLPRYENLGTLTNAPQVNATTFVNQGLFEVFTAHFYDTQNTLNFTNRGTMVGNPGFRFDYVNDDGIRRPAANFHNTRGASISAGTGFLFNFPFFDNTPFLFLGFDNPAIYINATNVINQGSLNVSAEGLISIQGETVNLSNGRLVVEPLGGFGRFGGFGFVTLTNFLPDVGIYDAYWGMDAITNLAVDTFMIDGPPTFVQTPLHNVTNGFGGFRTALFLTDPAAWGLSYSVGGLNTNGVPTNLVFQTVFVENADPDVTADVRWVSSIYPDFGPSATDLLTAVVELRAPATNIIAGTTVTNTIYVSDQLGSDTNFFTLTNMTFTLVPTTYRPSAYVISRSPPFGFFSGFESNIVVDSSIFWNPEYSNQVVTARYAAYSADVDSLASRLPLVPGASLTNLPGRIMIKGDNVNLSRARIRGEGIVSITTPNLLGSAGTVIDVQNLDFHLGSKTGSLNVQNLAQERVDRFSGNISMWSGVWTNFWNFLTPGETNVVTNVIQVQFHALVLDASQLSSKTRVVVNDFVARAPVAPSSVVITDNLFITNSFLVDATNLLVRGGLELGPDLRWNPSNLPRLRNFTNEGVIRLEGEADFGDTRPYDNLVNSGEITAFSHFIETDYFENTGEIISGTLVSLTDFVFTNGVIGIIETNFISPSVGPIQLEARNAKMEGGRFVTGGDIRLTADVMKFTDYRVEAGGGLYLNPTSAIQDTGGVGENLITVSNGVHLLVLPRTGDLLGTTIFTTAARFDAVLNRWAGRDLGDVPAGFTNNAAVGWLTLDGDFLSQHVLEGITLRNAIYVDVLELSGSVPANLDESIYLDNFNLYFADVRSTDPNAPVFVEDLDGRQFGEGKMFWVEQFVGPNSGIDVLVGPTGPTIRVNRAFRESERIDSDDDGIANRYDVFPFDPNVEISRGSSEDDRLGISFSALPNTTYRVEYTTTLSPPNWKLLKTIQTGPSFETIKVMHEAPSGEQRYYRLTFEVK